MKEYELSISGIQYILNKRGWVDLPAYGVSMYPLIKERDICRFIPLDPDHIAKGDIILFQTRDGRLVGHRYYHSFIKNRSIRHMFKGDTNVQYDPPVLTGQLIGKLVRIKKRAGYLNPDGLLAKGWGRLVFAFPILPRWCKSWLYLKNRYKHSSKEQHHASN